MIVEMRTYTIQPGSTPEYFKVYETMGMEAQRKYWDIWLVIMRQR